MSLEGVVLDTELFRGTAIASNTAGKFEPNINLAVDPVYTLHTFDTYLPSSPKPPKPSRPSPSPTPYKSSPTPQPQPDDRPTASTH
jgi:hypothetical protein